MSVFLDSIANSLQTKATKELLYEYYDGLSKKSNWQSVIADDFVFKGVGGASSEIKW